MKWLLALAVVLTACGGSSSTGNTFVLHDGSIDGPDLVSDAGTSVMEIANAGDWNHTFVVTDSEGRVVAATDLVAPGDETSLEVALTAGTYTVSCRIVAENDEGKLVDHFELGMFRTVVVEDNV